MDRYAIIFSDVKKTGKNKFISSIHRNSKIVVQRSLVTGKSKVFTDATECTGVFSFNLPVF